MPQIQITKKKNDPIFKSDQRQVQSNTFRNQEQGTYRVPMEALQTNPMDALANLMENYNAKLSEAVLQINMICSSIDNLDKAIQDVKKILEPSRNNAEKFANIKENLSSLKETRSELLKTSNTIVKDLIKEEERFATDRLKAERALLTPEQRSSDTWRLYEKNVLQDCKIKLVNTLSSTKLSEHISLPAELRLEVLQEQKASLNKVGMAEIKKAETAVSIKDKIRTIQKCTEDPNNDPANLRKIRGYIPKKDYSSLLDHCFQLKEKNWDKKRDTVLKSEFVLSNLEDCIEMMEAGNALIYVINNKGKSNPFGQHYVNLVEAKKKDGMQDEDAKAKAKEELSGNLKSLRNIFSYFRAHVQTVLADYGLEYDLRDGNYPTVCELKAEETTSAKQFLRWKDDYNKYRKLIGAELKQEQSPQKDEDAKLADLEKQLGIKTDPSLSLKKAGTEQKKDSSLLNDEKDRENNRYVRLNQYALNNYHNAAYDIMKARRMREVVRALTEKLKSDRNEEKNVLFDNLCNEFTAFIENSSGEKIHQHNQNAEVDHLWKRVKEQLDFIILHSTDYKEKHCAAFLIDQFIEIGGGELPEPNRIAYKALDAYFRDVDNHTKYTTEKGEGLKRMFVSAEDIPLFEHEPCLSDIGQGAVGDCYFLASIGSIVVNHPEKIKKMIRDNLDGTVTVRFYNCTEKGERDPIFIKVQKSIPVCKYTSGKVEDAFARGPLWVKMLEKAYAVVRNRSRVVIDKKTKRILGESFFDFDTNDRHYISYSNIEAGDSNFALQHLINANTSLMEKIYEKTELRVFEGRIDISNKPKDMKTLCYLSYCNQFKSDKEALSQLIQKGGPRSSQYKKAYARYSSLNELLEMMLISQEGEEALRVMDSGTFKAAIQTILSKLSTFKERNGRSISNRDLKAAGIPQKAMKAFDQSWKAYSKNGKEFYNALSQMIQLFMDQYDKSVRSSEYTKKEDLFFQKIKENVDQKRGCSIGTKIFTDFDPSVKGTRGERFKDGIFANHAYTIVGAIEHPLNGVKRKWLVLYNPHGRTVPIYKLNKNGSITRVSLKEEAPDADYYDSSMHGLFLMELRDAFRITDDLYVEK